MTYDYSGLARTSLQQIAKFGRTVTLRTVTAGTYDTAAGTRTGASESDLPVKAIVSNYKDRQIDDEIIRRGDKQIMIAASAVTSAPKANDIVVDDSDYKIVNVETIKPGDTALLYKLQVRK